jgi:glycerol-1-phosphate dehydrogenase [NAD(P)+]
VPTAASMDGYASGVAAMQVRGVKVTYPARPPIAIFADPRVAGAAPRQLTLAGIGDLLAKASARLDWMAAHVLYGEPFVAEAADRVMGPLAFAAANVEAVLAGDPPAVRGLLDGLIESGLAMAAAGSSRPASGCEHHASHFWDLLASRGLRGHSPHGIQVGYATRFAIRLQRFAFGGGVGELRTPRAPDPLGEDARAWLGEPGPGIQAAIAEKRRYVAAGADRWPAGERWPAIRQCLAPALEPFDGVERALDLAAIPARPGFLGLDADMMRATFAYSNRLRGRYTTVDFLQGQDALDDALRAAGLGPTSGRGRGSE